MTLAAMPWPKDLFRSEWQCFSPIFLRTLGCEPERSLTAQPGTSLTVVGGDDARGDAVAEGPVPIGMAVFFADIFANAWVRTGEIADSATGYIADSRRW